MERESFENEDIACHMNEHFVNIMSIVRSAPTLTRSYAQAVLGANDSTAAGR